MRLSLFLSVFILLIFGLVLVYQLAELPERFPFAHGFQSRIQGWFHPGSEQPGQESDFQLATPKHVLPDAQATNEGADTCGPPPAGPWELDHPPMPADFERYIIASRIWDYCRQNAGQAKEEGSPGLSRSRTNKAGNSLADYHRGEGSLE